MAASNHNFFRFSDIKTLWLCEYTYKVFQIYYTYVNGKKIISVMIGTRREFQGSPHIVKTRLDLRAK